MDAGRAARQAQQQRNRAKEQQHTTIDRIDRDR
jgi:hypothetical protein